MAVGKPFQPGNRFGQKFQPGQSGNPAGIPRTRLEFERAFNEALITHGSPEEAAQLLWKAARAGEPWAIQNLCQRFAPQAQSLRLEVARESNDEYDLTRLSDEQFRQVGEILELARVEPLALPEGS